MRFTKPKIVVTVVGISTLLLLSIVSGNFLAQNHEALSKDPSRDEVTKVVNRYWKLAEGGDLSEAGDLTTDTRKGFTIVEDNSVGTYEKMIYSTNLKLIRVVEIRTVDESEKEVVVKVRNRFDREYSLFHKVVKGDSGWKIFSTTR